mmetsp:Transcript_4337/g.7404  ORF Transcript_4337/g.7404 Transcript_4337/m.7404 type:complete len:135 (-) Transcript_4337:1189-1593(-)
MERPYLCASESCTARWRQRKSVGSLLKGVRERLLAARRAERGGLPLRSMDMLLFQLIAATLVGNGLPEDDADVTDRPAGAAWLDVVLEGVVASPGDSLPAWISFLGGVGAKQGLRGQRTGVENTGADAHGRNVG